MQEGLSCLQPGLSRTSDHVSGIQNAGHCRGPVGAVDSLKIDLTKLFGGGDALTMAAQERDRELVAVGREAVGLTVGIPKRQADKQSQPKDDLDSLMDQLDALDL